MTDSIPCRRCGQVTADMTRLWRTMPGGALVPYEAVCRPRCAPAPARRAPSPSAPAKRAVVTAFRPGKCAGCTWDIVPGDKIVHLGEAGSLHFECAPVEDVPLPGRRGPQAGPEQVDTRKPRSLA